MPRLRSSIRQSAMPPSRASLRLCSLMRARLLIHCSKRPAVSDILPEKPDRSEWAGYAPTRCLNRDLRCPRVCCVCSGPDLAPFDRSRPRAERGSSTRVFQTSDFDLFSDLKGVVDLDAQVAHRTLDSMASRP